jgi:hypothetical protein
MKETAFYPAVLCIVIERNFGSPLFVKEIGIEKNADKRKLGSCFKRIQGWPWITAAEYCHEVGKVVARSFSWSCS